MTSASPSPALRLIANSKLTSVEVAAFASKIEGLLADLATASAPRVDEKIARAKSFESFVTIEVGPSNQRHTLSLAHIKQRPTHASAGPHDMLRISGLFLNIVETLSPFDPDQYDAANAVDFLRARCTRWLDAAAHYRVEPNMQELVFGNAHETHDAVRQLINAMAWADGLTTLKESAVYVSPPYHPGYLAAHHYRSGRPNRLTPAAADFIAATVPGTIRLDCDTPTTFRLSPDHVTVTIEPTSDPIKAMKAIAKLPVIDGPWLAPLAQEEDA